MKQMKNYFRKKMLGKQYVTNNGQGEGRSKEHIYFF